MTNLASIRKQHSAAFRTALINNGVEPNTRGDFTYQVQYSCYHHDSRGRMKTSKINFYTDDIELADKIAADFKELKPRNRQGARGHVVVRKRETAHAFTDHFRRAPKK